MMTTDIKAIITEAATRYGLDPDTALRITQIESSLNPSAQNPKSSAGDLDFLRGGHNKQPFSVTVMGFTVPASKHALRFTRCRKAGVNSGEAGRASRRLLQKSEGADQIDGNAQPPPLGSIPS